MSRDEDREALLGADGDGAGDSSEPSQADADDADEAPAGGASDMGNDEDEPRARTLPRRRGRQASAERLYIVAYDIASQKRWRRVFRAMKGYGRWLQLSVFQCRLTGRRRAELGAALERLIHHRDDHVIILDLGPADQIDPRVESLGKSFSPIVREAIIV